MSKTRDGYILNDNGKLVHREHCRKIWGPFPSRWVVHHCNGNKIDNAAENLIALPDKLHGWIHHAYGFKEHLPNRDICSKWLSRFRQGELRCKSELRIARKYRNQISYVPSFRQEITRKNKSKFKPIIIVRKKESGETRKALCTK